MWPFGRVAAAKFAEKIIHNAASIEVRSIDTKLMNTEKMFELINQRLERIEKALQIEKKVEPKDYTITGTNWTMNYTRSPVSGSTGDV